MLLQYFQPRVYLPYQQDPMRHTVKALLFAPHYCYVGWMLQSYTRPAIVVRVHIRLASVLRTPFDWQDLGAGEGPGYYFYFGMLSLVASGRCNALGRIGITT